MNIKIAMVASALTLSALANAAVTYDGDGVGFVGKGDVQSIYDWNNYDFQENAELVEFRMLTGGGTTWKCSGNNPAGKLVIQTKGSESEGVNAEVGYDARKNRQGQVTGFILTGLKTAQGGMTIYQSIDYCSTAPNDKWSNYGLVEGSVNENGGGDPLLQVSIDGENWFDLPITE
jgi:hypothetical protein